MSPFRFSISDLGCFLGKSPVTLRAWERKGFVSLPRIGSTRALTAEQVRGVAQTAYDAGRISEERWLLINEALTLLGLIEEENT